MCWLDRFSRTSQNCNLLSSCPQNRKNSCQLDGGTSYAKRRSQRSHSPRVQLEHVRRRLDVPRSISFAPSLLQNIIRRENQGAADDDPRPSAALTRTHDESTQSASLIFKHMRISSAGRPLICLSQPDLPVFLTFRTPTPPHTTHNRQSSRPSQSRAQKNRRSALSKRRRLYRRTKERQWWDGEWSV